MLAGVISCLLGCSHKVQPELMSEQGQVLQGTHLLRQVSQSQVQESHIHGDYFLIAGGFEGSSTSQTTYVTFAWFGNDGVYRFTKLPLEKIMIALNDDIGTPFVKFRWNDYGIIYAIIGANPKDWPVNLHIPSVPAGS